MMMQLTAGVERKNKEIREMTKIPVITSYIKRLSLKWFGHVKQRKATSKARVIMERQLEGKN